MREVLAITFKDFSKFRLLIIIWTGLLILMTLTASDTISERIENNPIRVLWVLRHLLPMLIIPGLFIHEDNIQNSDAAWLSRPTARNKLLAAKIISIFTICVALTAVAEVTYLIMLGLPYGKAPLAIAETLLHNATLILPFMLVAAMTSSFGQFLLSGIPLLVLQVLIPFLYQFAFPSFVRTIQPLEILTHQQAVSDSALVISQSLLTCTTFATLVYLYRTRELSWGLIGLCFSFMIAGSVRLFWPYAFTPVANYQETAQNLVVKVEVARTDVLINSYRSSIDPDLYKNTELISFAGDITTGNPAIAAQVAGIKNTKVILSDNTQIDLNSSENGGFSDICLSSKQALALLTQAKHKIDSIGDHLCTIADFYLDRDQAVKIKSGIQQLEGQAEIDLYQLEFATNETQDQRNFGSYPDLIHFSSQVGDLPALLPFEKRRFSLIFDSDKALPTLDRPFGRSGVYYHYLSLDSERGSAAVIDLEYYRDTIINPFSSRQMTREAIKTYPYFCGAAKCKEKLIEVKAHYLKSITVPLLVLKPKIR